MKIDNCGRASKNSPYRPSKNTKRLLIYSILISFFIAAHANSSEIGQQRSRNWSNQGSITLAKPVPTPSLKADFQDNSPQLGRMPLHKALKQSDSKWLSIDSTKGSLYVMQGTEILAELKAKGVELLQAGNYEIIHKQRQPLWYATEAYYQNRGLKTPPEGSKRRYLRGALGEFVLYIDRHTPIHSSPVWSAEVGGLKIAEKDISRLYYLLEVGSKVIIN